MSPESVGVEDELEGSISAEVTIAGVEKTPVGNKVAAAAALPVVDTGKEAARPVKACVGNKAVEVAISARDSLVFIYQPWKLLTCFARWQRRWRRK